MISQSYKNAYKEVLEIIKYLPKKDLYKIPKDKIEYFKRNQNVDYEFNFDVSIPLEEQKISREANAIILNLFNEYFISDNQKETLASILDFNEKEYQENQIGKDNIEDIFNNRKAINDNQINNEESISNDLPILVNKSNIFMKLIRYLKKFFHFDI